MKTPELHYLMIQFLIKTDNIIWQLSYKCYLQRELSQFFLPLDSESIEVRLLEWKELAEEGHRAQLL